MNADERNTILSMDQILNLQAISNQLDYLSDHASRSGYVDFEFLLIAQIRLRKLVEQLQEIYGIEL